MAGERVLIVKTGYSEFLDNDPGSTEVSLGDIMRTTVLLHHYKNDEVTWLTDEYALPLLKGNPFISELLVLDFWNSIKLQDMDFDTIINLEKNHNICELVRRIEAWKRFGFRLDRRTCMPMAYDRAFEAMAVSTDIKLKRKNKRTFQELLYGLVGAEWKEEEYVLGYKPTSQEMYDIALNTRAGKKWPTKSWPDEKWSLLEKKLMKEGLNVTVQHKQPAGVLSDIHSYIDWLNSSKIIISNDSLGMHLGFALKKKVLGLFGPTPCQEVYFYGRGEPILPDKPPECMPCFQPECKFDETCINSIEVEKVYKKVKEFIT